MNKLNWRQFAILFDTKANIEALTGVADGTPAYATDTNEPGWYNGATWDWGGGDISGTGVVGQVARFVTDTKTIEAGALIPPATNILTLTNAAASTLALNITAGKTLTLTAADNYTLIIPATGTAALLATAQTFSAINYFTRSGGISNTMIGGAGNTTSTGTDNVLIGFEAGKVVSFGTNNVYIGSRAGLASLGGYSNFGLGSYALQRLTSGHDVVAVGSSSLAFITTNSFSVGIGTQAGFNSTGASNIFIGYKAGMQQTTLSNLVIIDNADRGSEANEILKSYLYGVNTTDGYLRINIPATTTNAVVEAFKIHAYVSTAATGGAAGFGSSLALYVETATDGTSQLFGRINAVVVDPVNATYKGKLQLIAKDSGGERLGLEIEATGTAVKLGFFGGTTAVQQVLNAYTSDGEGAAYTGIDNAQAGTVYATVADLNALRVAYETLRASYDDLRTKLQTSTIVG